jgi:hypothetical protein
LLHAQAVEPGRDLHARLPDAFTARADLPYTEITNCGEKSARLAAGELSRDQASLPDYPSRIAGGHSTGRNVAEHNAAGADEAAIANVTPGRMMTPPPIHTPLAIRIGRTNSNPESRDVAQRSASSFYALGHHRRPLYPA